jgi:hypothetical protein
MWEMSGSSAMSASWAHHEFGQLPSSKQVETNKRACQKNQAANDRDARLNPNSSSSRLTSNASSAKSCLVATKPRGRTWRHCLQSAGVTSKIGRVGMNRAHQRQGEVGVFGDACLETPTSLTKKAALKQVSLDNRRIIELACVKWQHLLWRRQRTCPHQEARRWILLT